MQDVTERWVKRHPSAAGHLPIGWWRAASEKRMTRYAISRRGQESISKRKRTVQIRGTHGGWPTVDARQAPGCMAVPAFPYCRPACMHPKALLGMSAVARAVSPSQPRGGGRRHLIGS